MEDGTKAKEPSIGEIASKLKGKTLRVYWYMLKNPEETSLRQVQKGAELSSPSLASYHLEKLRELKLVYTDEHGAYFLKRDLKVGVLRLFMGSGRLLVPRYLSYALFYTIVLIAYVTLLPITYGPVSFLLLATLLFGVVTSWVETFRALRIEI